MRVQQGAEAAIRRRWEYWPEIDGLRTIAVLSVFAFHFRRALLPGGFVGVDIFFVISGFLIGSILLDDIAKRQFSVAAFYHRRISRIFPALILVICATLAAGALLYSAQDMASLGISAAAAAVSLINMKLIAQGSYFVISADAQPLLHYWSLAVEEQFYLVFPIFLFLVMRFTKRPLAIMLACAAISFALCVWMTSARPTFAFYALPTRAWELLIGSSLALYRSEGGRVPSAFAAPSAWSGLALILASVLLIDEAGGFPGWIAALPVIGTALLIAPVGDARPLPLRVLARPWMVAIGKRSYSLYLWHWPVFSFVDYRFFESNELLRGVLKIAVTLALTELTYRYVEKPARAYLNLRTRRQYSFAAAALVAVLLAGTGVWLRSALYFDVPPALIASGGVIVRGGDKARVILSGDSQAAMYGREIGSIAREQGFTLYALGTAGKNQLPGEAGTHWPEVAAFAAKTKPDLVILIDAWSEKLKGDPESLRRALADIAGSAKHVLLVTQPPGLPVEATREGIRHGAHSPFLEPADIHVAHRLGSATVHGLASDRVSVIDVADLFADPAGGVRVIAPDGRLTYYDRTHLSDRGTAMTRSMLAAAIRQALEKP